MPIRAIASAVPRVATISKPLSCRIWATAKPDLSVSVTLMKGGPLAWQRHARGRLRLGEGGPGKSRAIPINLACRAHLGPEQRVGPSKRSNGSTALLDGHVLAVADALLAAGSCGSTIRSPSMIRQASFASGTPIALETTGTVREARQVCLDHAQLARVDGVLYVQQSPTTPIARAISRVATRTCSSISSPSEVRRQHAGAVA